jgi:hypothetical protein
MTVSRNSPSTNIRVPSTSRPSPTKNAVTVLRSETVIPTWSKRRTCVMGSILACSSCRSTRRDGANAGVDMILGGNVHPAMIEQRLRTRSAAAGSVTGHQPSTVLGLLFGMPMPGYLPGQSGSVMRQ